jgi:hypothetical protein
MIYATRDIEDYELYYIARRSGIARQDAGIPQGRWYERLRRFLPTRYRLWTKLSFFNASAMDANA